MLLCATCPCSGNGRLWVSTFSTISTHDCLLRPYRDLHNCVVLIPCGLREVWSIKRACSSHYRWPIKLLLLRIQLWQFSSVSLAEDLQFLCEEVHGFFLYFIVLIPVCTIKSAKSYTMYGWGLPGVLVPPPHVNMSFPQPCVGHATGWAYVSNSM
jgi:hypothetical protein